MNAVLRLWDGYNHTSPDLRDAVRELQQQLSNHGFSTPIDGFFGHGTEELVERFQAANGLTVDGIVGPQTWSAFAGANPPDTDMFDTSYSRTNPSLIKEAAIARTYADFIRFAAQDAGVHQSVICGIGSRESAWGLALTPPFPYGTGDFAKRNNTKPFRPGQMPPDGKGYGRGLLQIDYDAHEFARGDQWKDPARNIAYGGSVLRKNIIWLREHMPSLSGMNLLRAAVAGYNCGCGNVLRAIQSGRSVDFYTAHRDYSADVLSRAGWFQLNGW